MFKRVRWMSLGAAVGVGGSVWAQRRVRRAVERYLPDQVVASAGSRARNLREDVRDALDEGRLAMRAREDELRGDVEDRPPTAPRAADAEPQVIDVDERRSIDRRSPPRRPRGSEPSLPPARRATRHRRR